MSVTPQTPKSATDALAAFIKACDDLAVELPNIPDTVDGIDLRVERNQAGAALQNHRNQILKLMKLSDSN